MRTRILLAAALVAAASPGTAHVLVTPNTAAPGSKMTASFKVGHGCAGSPTVAVKIVYPAGVSGLTPLPREGWTLKTDAVSATWTNTTTQAGKTAVAVDFGMTMNAPRNSAPVYFTVLQSCVVGEVRWSQVPSGVSGEVLQRPAPAIYVGVKPPAHGTAHDMAAMPGMAMNSAPAAATTVPGANVNVTVSDAWLRALPGALPAGGYFKIRNNGAAAATLTGARSAACGTLMLHESSTTGGVSRMAHVVGVKIAPGTSVSFSPGGYHLMCEKPGAAVKPGGRVPVTLLFDTGTANAGFAVRNAAGK